MGNSIHITSAPKRIFFCAPPICNNSVIIILFFLISCNIGLLQRNVGLEKIFTENQVEGKVRKWKKTFSFLVKTGISRDVSRRGCTNIMLKIGYNLSCYSCVRSTCVHPLCIAYTQRISFFIYRIQIIYVSFFILSFI